MSFQGFVMGVGLVLSAHHPLHVSVTEIEFDEKDHALEIVIRFFTEDLEIAIQNAQKNKALNMVNPPPGITTDKIVNDYLANHFSISLNDKNQKVHYLGHEIDGDALLVYLEVTNVKKWSVITIKHNSLLETYDDQSNIVNVTVRDEVKSLRLIRENPSDKLTFEFK